MDSRLQQRIDAMRQDRGPSYEPRTRHFDPNGRARYTNRLFLESSPYLLQHAHNPVDWYPWGDEAFETARQTNRPVLLSVGYSTCHWCHVMEEESFEDEEIARFINANYIAVKVDREERPDVDAVYMAAVQALTGGGGWPMTVWLTPDRKPFYGGTYFPARDGDRGAGVGFLTILQKLKESYDLRQDIIAKTSLQLVDAVKQILLPAAGGQVPNEDLLKRAFESYQSRFDEAHGGLSGAPKFPSSLPVRFLLRYYRRTRDAEALRMAVTTLEKMASGGLYDHVGGGFHRYATDAGWLVPHFEKMLYDNALLVMDYLEAYQVTGNPAFERTVHEVLGYVQRDMTAPAGAFYSATDADSLTPGGRREEGYFFTWTPRELQQALGDDLFAVVNAYLVDGPFPNFEGRFILHTTESRETVAAQLNMDLDAFDRAVAAAKAILLEARSRRPAPLRDEKILTAWNGLMISAFARAGFVLDNPAYLKHAADAADFILSHLLADRRLLRSYKDGHARHNGYLEDYAFVTAGLIDLFDATQDLKWLQAALSLDQTLADHYEDEVDGGFFATSDDHEALIAREKPNYDGATPSGNAIAVMNLLRLGALTSNPAFAKRAEKALLSMGAVLNDQPTALAELLSAIDFYHSEPLEIIVAVPRGRREQAAPFLDGLRRRFLPNRTLAVFQEGPDRGAFEALLPMTRSRATLGGKAVAYVCRNHACRLPTGDPDEFAGLLDF